MITNTIRRTPTHSASQASLVVLICAVLAGCAASSAPAPVEQRRPTPSTPVADAPRMTTAPAPAPVTGDAASSGVQITGLGNDNNVGMVQTRPTPGGEAPPTAAGTSYNSQVSAGAGGGPAVSNTPAPPAGESFPVANPAVVALLNRANRDAAAGRHGASAASLERAIKIEPGNAWLWHRLAQTRLQQNQPGEAASLAARSNSLAGTDDKLRVRNWRLIAEVHRLRGETGAAQAAQRKAEQLERATS